MIFVSLCGKKTRKKMMFLSLFLMFLSPYQNNVEKPKMSFTPFQMKAPWMRQQFLSLLLHQAVEEEREEDVKRIQEQIRNEHYRRQWRGIKMTMNQNSINSVTHCQVTQEDGTIRDCDTKEEVEEAISQTLSKLFPC